MIALRLLVITPGPVPGNALIMALQKSRYALDMAKTPDALDFMPTVRHDGIILCCASPAADAIGMLGRLLGRGHHVPILLIASSMQDCINGLDAGADDCLSMPFDTGELLARIRAMIRRSKARMTDLYQVGETQLDPASYELRTGSTSIRLSHKEYHLMETLMQNRDRFLTTEQLMNRIWGYDSDTEIGVVWVYISRLRQKLRMASADIHIEAARSRGYRIRTENDCPGTKP